MDYYFYSQKQLGEHQWGFCELRGNCTLNQKLAFFVLYLKIVNIFLKNDICIL